MKLFTLQEFNQYLGPVLIGYAGEVDNAVACVALSMLVEAGDCVAGKITEYITPSQLLQAIIQRLDAKGMASLLGGLAVSNVEERFENRWESIWSNASERWIPRLSKNHLIENLKFMANGGSGILQPHGVVIRESLNYPPQLLDLGDAAPFTLWTIGNSIHLTDDHQVSIVGARQASSYGLDVVADIAVVAAQLGVTTVSGGAFGIDAAVHAGAASLGAPTIAFMAGGLANLYPKSNRQLLERVSSNGVLVSESAPQTSVAKFRFLTRNRLIAAQSPVTIVIEAGRTSGALNTAKYGVLLGRDVRMVPGVIYSSRSAGCHDFLNNNPEVRLFARPQQLGELLGMELENLPTESGLGQLEKRALDTFSGRSIESWEVQRLAGLTVKETQLALGSLELLGLVQRRGSAYRRVQGQENSL